MAAPLSASAPHGAAANDELSLADLLSVLHRRRWLLLAGLFLGGLAGLGILAVLPPVYEARALLIIEPALGGVTGATIATPSQTPDSAAVDSQVQILASRSLARQTIDALGLAGDPELGATDGHPVTGPLAILPSLSRNAPAGLPADAVAAFLDRLAVEREGKSHVIALAWRSADPEKAARVVNRLAELYMAGQQSRKRAASLREAGRSDEQLETLRRNVEAAEARLAGFNRDSEAARAAGLGADPAEIAALDAQLVAASVARSGREHLLDRLRRLAPTGDEALGAGDPGASPMLANLLALKAELLRREAELSGQFGERHPRIAAIRTEKAELDRRIREERQGVVRQHEGEVAQARAAERILAGKLEELKGRALRREADAQRAAELAREVELSRRVYETYLARVNAEPSPPPDGTPDARLISEAVPPNVATQPKPKLILSLTLTGGLLLGLAAMYVAEVGRRGIRSAREVTALLGVPTLALVPQLTRSRQPSIAPQDYVLDRPRSRYAEALREILTGLVLQRAEDGTARGRVVLVTSALPGEGKSTLTLSLARAAAAEGLRVMVVDADLRRPKLHELVGLTQPAGLVEVLRREVQLAEALATDPRAPVRLLPGSRRLAQPTRLLGQDGLGTLLAALRPAFDLILVDSAPLVAVVDAKLVARLADDVLFLIRYGRTRRDLSELALRSLRDSGASIAGAVLTQVDLRRHARSGAGDAGFAYARLGEYYSE
jgi:capsular exopolysaccharide synthesis family protein